MGLDKGTRLGRYEIRAPLGAGQPAQVTDFASDDTHGFAVSRDGRRLILARGPSRVSIVLIKDFR